MDNKNLNKIGSITLALIGFVSSMITIVNGYSETIATLSKYLGFIISHILAYRDREKYEVNSIFTYLINQRKRYWMSNDLQIDQMNGNFFTSSDNYPEYYKSLAVFSIAPPDKDVLPEGLLIFDTKKTGKFSETECAQLFGYIAHLLYELLTEYNKYESKKKQKSR